MLCRYAKGYQQFNFRKLRLQSADASHAKIQTYDAYENMGNPFDAKCLASKLGRM